MRLEGARRRKGSRLERLPRAPYPLHQTNKPRLTSQIREKRLVLGEPWQIDEAELDGALAEIDRRVALVHQRKAISEPPGEDLIPLRGGAQLRRHDAQKLVALTAEGAGHGRRQPRPCHGKWVTPHAVEHC